MLLCRTGPLHTISQNWGRMILPRCRTRNPRFSKILNARQRTNPATFCLILPEAYWLTANKKRKYKNNYSSAGCVQWTTSAEQLRAKSIKTLVAISAGRGIAIIAEAQAKSER